MTEFTLVFRDQDGAVEELGRYPAKYHGAESFIQEICVLHSAMTPDRGERLIEANRRTLDSIVEWAKGKTGGEVRWLERRIAGLLSS